MRRRHDVLQNTAGLNAEVFDALLLVASGSWQASDLRRVHERLMRLVREMDELRQKANGRQPEVIITAANIAFFVTRIMLALGQFNYSRKGILGIGHRRLFTFKSLRALLEQAGYAVMEERGVPAPFPLARRR